MKKEVLIVIDSLGSGGAEKSLINLLSLINYSKYNVDLLLFARGGINEQFVPSEVNILPSLNFSKKRNIDKFRFYLDRFHHYLISRTVKTNDINLISRRFWELIGTHYEGIDKIYDVALGYAQRYPTLFVAEKVNAKKKYTWLNVTIHQQKRIRDYYSQFLKKIDGIVCVSDTVKETFDENYPELSSKGIVIYDIINPRFVEKLSEKECNIVKRPGIVNILTVARLNFGQKGYDIALKVAWILKEKGIKFKWYALGDGDENLLKLTIRKYNLEENFILLGTDPNPYPYFRDTDIYVQTSRFEGYGLAIAEARMLNIPVVTTPYDCVNLQIKNKINGIISTFEPEDIANDIVSIINDQNLYNLIKENLLKEKKGNIEEFSKIEKILNS